MSQGEVVIVTRHDKPVAHFVCGIILHTDAASVLFGNRIHALPIGAL